MLLTCGDGGILAEGNVSALPDGMARRPLTTQLPPLSKMSMPHFAASGCVHDTTPLALCTTLRRLGNFAVWPEVGG